MRNEYINSRKQDRIKVAKAFQDAGIVDYGHASLYYGKTRLFLIGENKDKAIQLTLNIRWNRLDHRDESYRIADCSIYSEGSGSEVVELVRRCLCDNSIKIKGF